MLWIYILGAGVVGIGMSAFFGAPYVPSHRKDIRALFDEGLAIGPSDVILDIGSGDGIVLREASRRQAKAIGYEIHPLFVAIAKLLSWNDPRVTVRWTNAWSAPFPKDVTMVYIFSVGRDARKLEKKVQDETNSLQRPVQLVCYGNALHDQVIQRQVGAYFIYTFEPLHLC